MNIQFCGSNFVPEGLEVLKVVARARGHNVDPSNAAKVVTFLMGTRGNSDDVRQLKKQSGVGFVVVLLPSVDSGWQVADRWETLFFKAGAYEVLLAPHTEKEAHQLFARLEVELGMGK